MMKTKKLKTLLLLLIIGGGVTYAQEVVSTAGGHDVGDIVQVSWTIGEPVIETGLNGQYYLTQGMHQGDMTINTIAEIQDLGFNINAYPNPVVNELKLNIDKFDLRGLNYVLFYENGQLLDKGEVLQKETIIQMAKYRPSTYILRVKSGDYELKSFKIIKRE
ncbi:MAG: T9SS type A sorting domain-containing protein [Draconibacterium sp.]|nr:T9SS type A sorting domain-containing protein [Draconibacterium sp.]